MARTADHEQRRRQVAEALLRTVAERGLARTTLADVAEEAGVSVGLVQRYFRSKRDLLVFGVEYMYARSEERIRSALDAPPIRDLLFRLGERALLPLDEERRLELVVWLDFLPATLTDPDLARLHKRTTADLLDALTGVMAEARRLGELPEDRDPRAEAAAYVAFVDGLTLHHLVTTEEFGAESVLAALASYLDRLFPAPESP
jgi:AcrR family transcriptional regulator